MGDLPRRREERERDRQVVARSLLPQAGRREIDRDAAAWKLELRRPDTAAHTLPRLRTGAVGEADDDERRRAVSDVRLDLHPTWLEADERMRYCTCEHISTLRRDV